MWQDNNFRIYMARENWEAMFGENEPDKENEDFLYLVNTFDNTEWTWDDNED